MARAAFSWTCGRTGDCCRQAGALVMSHQEADLVVANTTRPLAWVPHPNAGLVGLVHPEGRPQCPLLGDDGLCTIHAVRPYNCRRFLCLRDPGEPLQPGGPLGCRNTETRVIQVRGARRFYEKNQRRAQRWARDHGWPEDA